MTSPALVGSRPQRTREPAQQSRDSNALRASVLDAALQLGIGTSRAVENLIFDSVLEEDESVTTPALTSASDESWPSAPAFRSIEFVLPVSKPPNVAPTLTSEVQAALAPSEDSQAPNSLRLRLPRKLRKQRKDDYESDGGSFSDNSRKKRANKDQNKGSGSTFEAEYQSDGGYLSDTKKGLDKKKKQKEKKGNKVADNLDVDPSKRASRKSTKKSSRASSDDGDLSDGAYLSEASVKKKKPFFRLPLRSRSPSATRKGPPTNDVPPPVPALPRTPTPLRSFGTSTPIPAAYSPIPPSLDEPPFAPSASSDSVRTTARSLSVDTSSENFTPSISSHEMGRHSPILPLSQTWEATSYVPRLRNPERPALSPVNPREQASPPLAGASRSHGVRFTPSTRFDPSDAIFPIPPSPPAVLITSENEPEPPTASPSTNSRSLKASPSPVSPSPVSPGWRSASPVSISSEIRPFLSRTLRSTPSPLTLPPSTPLSSRASPALSEPPIMSSSDLPNPRPRFFEDLPPPSPPPTCPLPEVPSQGLYAQPIPQIRRGRQLPFPARGILPVQEASRLIERAERTRQEVLQARLLEAQAAFTDDAFDDNMLGDDLDEDLPRLAERVTFVPSSDRLHEGEDDWPDEELLRPDIAQFYLYAPPSPIRGPGRLSPRPTPDVPDDERSTYTYSYAASSSSADMYANGMTTSTHSGIHTHYFEEFNRGRDGGAGERPVPRKLRR